MNQFKEKVAVVTGAASGIGKGFAERCVQAGMKVVLADVEERALMHTAEELEAAGGVVLPVKTDVSKQAAIETLAKRTTETYGGVHLLFNNAGVANGAPILESSTADWEWVLGVNLWGVIHGVRTFLPIMMAQDEPCHIVNTASIAGLVAGPGLGAYNVSKFGVVALSETLHQELALLEAKVKVSVLCPYWVKTQIADSGRNRPAELQNERAQSPLGGNSERGEAIAAAIRTGLSPADVADQIFEAIVAEKLYILTHPETKTWIAHRTESIIEGRNPMLNIL